MSPGDPAGSAPGAPDPVRPVTYADSGVDISAGEDAVARITAAVAATARPEVLGGIGDFGGLFAPRVAGMREPVLVASTDGVGTKAEVARELERYDTIGVDLVAMCVDDLVCQGAEPLFLLDYVATGLVEPDRMAELVGGIARGCSAVGAALLGGEMAEHAGIMRRGEFDLAGFAVGLVDRDELLSSARVREGDLLVGIGSPGLRCNGYTLARHVLLEVAGRSYDDAAADPAHITLGEELLLPSVLYAPAVRAAIAAGGVHAAAHITGGGIPGNLPRSLPAGLGARLEVGTWAVPAIFGMIAELGPVEEDEMRRVFNLGLGMVLVVEAGRAGAICEVVGELGHAASVVGEVVAAAPGGERIVFDGGPVVAVAS